MKKMFTLLAVTLITASSFAQWGNNDRRDNNRSNGNYGYGSGRYNNDPYHVFNFRTEDELLRDMNLNRFQERKISRINQQFQQAISRVQFDRFSSAQQKRFQIERLEQQRKQDILNVLSGYQRDRFNAWCNRNNTYGSTYGNGRYGQGNGNGIW